MDTLTRMRAFLSVVDAEGFSAAARKTGRSKALLSKYVRELEDELGVLLINRTTRQVALTAAGEIYVSRASTILADLEALNEEAREATGEARGTLRVTAARTFGDAALGLSLVEFSAAHPDISLDLHLNDAFVNLVDEGFDVAIRMTRLTDSAMIARRLASLDFTICATPEFLAIHGTPTHPTDISRMPAVIDSNAKALYNWTFKDPATGDPIPVNVSGRFSANSPYTVRAATLAGLGVALTPDFVVRDDIAQGRLVSILEDFVPRDAGIYAVFPHRRHLPARTRVFVDFLATWFRKNAGGRDSAAD
ncbi:LysR family transcriptional regulator [Aureimonas pseudogalii]|uniref:DNA-binding transcriptional LysR family regulator n=1 Tax=Aureimonas pseudogalii TaxID=1744844 RepID=A0A7W6H5Q3_9HYPH|nr:LysR family transcriptional regulator [Aureimonas pseudogalii]MBB3999019.1 DNA-binding transcriptional LysR family regulator [Aureimonas pseudogalii]